MYGFFPHVVIDVRGEKMYHPRDKNFAHDT